MGTFHPLAHMKNEQEDWTWQVREYKWVKLVSKSTKWGWVWVVRVKQRKESGVTQTWPGNGTLITQIWKELVAVQISKVAKLFEISFFGFRKFFQEGFVRLGVAASVNKHLAWVEMAENDWIATNKIYFNKLTSHAFTAAARSKLWERRTPSWTHWLRTPRSVSKWDFAITNS